MSRQPFHLRQRFAHTLPYLETERQQTFNNIWFCILGNQGFVHMNALITELLTASIAKDATYRRQNTYSKIINVADCKTSKKRLLAAKYLVLIITIIQLLKQQHYINLQMDPLRTSPIQTGWMIGIEPCPNWPFRCIDNPDHQFGNGLVLNLTRTRSDGPEPLLLQDLRIVFLCSWQGQRTVQRMKRKWHGLLITWIEYQKWQESMLKMPRQWLCTSKIIWEMLKKHHRQPDSLKEHLTRWWMLSEIARAIWHDPKMRWME